MQKRAKVAVAVIVVFALAFLFFVPVFSFNYVWDGCTSVGTCAFNGSSVQQGYGSATYVLAKVGLSVTRYGWGLAWGFGHTQQLDPTPSSIALPSSSQAQALANQVEQNPTFVASENGTTYQFISYAGLGIDYRNGTQTEGTLILYFDDCAPGSQCGMINGPTILSQLQVYTTMTGQVLSTHPITNTVELNNNYG